MLTVILPTRNEVATIGRMIDEIRALNLGAFIVVLDHNSTDGTRDAVIARMGDDDGLELVDEPEKGKGVAVRHYLEDDFPGNIVMIDADCTYPVARIPEIVATLDAGSDVVMGYRRWRDKGAMSVIHSLGNDILSLWAATLFCFPRTVEDVCTGLWGFGHGVTGNFDLVSDGFTLEADLFANAIRCGSKISQIPVEYYPRPDGSTAKLTAFDGVKIAWFLLMSRLGRR